MVFNTELSTYRGTRVPFCESINIILQILCFMVHLLTFCLPRDSILFSMSMPSLSSESFHESVSFPNHVILISQAPFLWTQFGKAIQVLFYLKRLKAYKGASCDHFFTTLTHLKLVEIFILYERPYFLINILKFGESSEFIITTEISRYRSFAHARYRCVHV